MITQQKKVSDIILKVTSGGVEQSLKQKFKKLLKYIRAQFSSKHQISKISCDCIYAINKLLCTISSSSKKLEFWSSFTQRLISLMEAKQLNPKFLRIKQNCFNFCSNFVYTSFNFRKVILAKIENLYNSIKKMGNGLYNSVQVNQGYQILKLNAYAAMYRWCSDFSKSFTHLILWKKRFEQFSKINNNQLIQNQLAEQEQFKFKKYCVIMLRNKEQMKNQVSLFMKQAFGTIDSIIEIFIEIKNISSSQHAWQYQKDINIQLQNSFKLIKDQKANFDQNTETITFELLEQNLNDQSKIIQRRIEPLLKLFHDQTFSLIMYFKKDFTSERVKKSQAQEFLSSLNSSLNQCQEYRVKISKVLLHKKKMQKSDLHLQQSDDEAQFARLYKLNKKY